MLISRCHWRRAWNCEPLVKKLDHGLGGCRGSLRFPVALGLRQVEADEELNLSHWINPLNDGRQVASRDIAFLRGRPGPVLCETLALCYWAKKGPEVDVFNVGQQFATENNAPMTNSLAS